MPSPQRSIKASRLAVPAAAAALGALSLTPTAMAGPLAITLGPARACQPLRISWDTSKGTAPWTLAIVPFNHVPTTLSLPSTYTTGSTWSYSWPVPSFRDANMKLAVAVTDASGSVSGVSQFTPITGSGSCGVPAESLDFIWFLDDKNPKPRECGAWPIGWKVDDGNNGIVDPVAITFLPEGGTPQTFTASANDQSWNWNVSYARGTRFTIVMTDKGKSGTGGVGLEYDVGAARRGTTCNPASVVNAGLRNGLMAPTSTVARAAAIPSSGMSTSKGHALNGATRSGTPKTTDTTGAANEDPTTESKSHTGAIVGAIFGVLAALALVGGVFWFVRRRRGQDETQRPFEQQFVSPWRYSVDGARSGGVQQSNNGTRGMAGLFAALGAKARSATARKNDYPHEAGSMRSGNDMASLVQNSNVSYPYQSGHHQHDSVSSAVAGTGAAVHRRRESALGGAPPSTRTMRSNRSIHSTVPDEALFPPPPPPGGYRTVPDDQLFTPPSGFARGASPNVGTPLAGVGAGIAAGLAPGTGTGGYRALNRGASGEIVVAGDYFANANPAQQQQYHQHQQQQQQPHQVDSSRIPSKQRGARTSELDLLERTLHCERQASRATAHAHEPSEGGSISVERDVAQLQRTRNDQRARDTDDPIATRYIPGGKTSVHDPYAHVSQLFDNEDIAARINGFAPKDNEAPPPVPALPPAQAAPTPALAPAPRQAAAPVPASAPAPQLAPAPSAREEWRAAAQAHDVRAIQSEIMPAMLVSPRTAGGGGGGGATSPFADPPKGFAQHTQASSRRHHNDAQRQTQKRQSVEESSDEEAGLAYL